MTVVYLVMLCALQLIVELQSHLPFTNIYNIYYSVFFPLKSSFYSSVHLLSYFSWVTLGSLFEMIIGCHCKGMNMEVPMMQQCRDVTFSFFILKYYKISIYVNKKQLSLHLGLIIKGVVYDICTTSIQGTTCWIWQRRTYWALDLDLLKLILTESIAYKEVFSKNIHD